MTRAELDKNPHAVAAMFDDVASRYDLTNDLLSVFQDRIWRVATRTAVGALPGQRVLDLAAGTGTSTEEWADRGINVVACDFSEGMLAVGKQRRDDIPFIAGDAMALPFADETFDAVTISFGLRNIADTAAALTEMYRVTKPGGRIVICEFSTPTFAPLRAAYEFYLGTALPTIAGAFSSNAPAYSYLMESILDWPAQRELAQIMHSAGWRGIKWRNLSGGIVALHRAHKVPPVT
ncbi:demethylmenaquinone methyltransferase [Bowdeniella massiliensis]|uniref:demethylmenaquinone methyltransferase n=1 Tax=Bowdeniella massiliensis TaxID=2932264 RepID=UPI0020290299|nr:demethylmenaquinone methyltransferase [Bowdeniella massiliensis]